MDLKLNSGHDIFITGQDLTLTQTDEEVVQRLDIRLQFFQGEWFLDITAGLPYLQTIFKKGVALETVSSLFLQEINNADNVDEVLEFALDFQEETRALTVTFKAQTVNDGIVSIVQDITI